MKDFNGKLAYKDKEYTVVFNLNVMQAIQDEYGSLGAWGDLTDGTVRGEPDAKAVIFGLREMINEGLDIEAEESGTQYVPLTLKQVGRILTEVGLSQATSLMNETVIESTRSVEEKNV